MRTTAREGLEGFEECVGGGARPGRVEQPGPRFGWGPRARCVEFAAGNWGRRVGDGVEVRPFVVGGGRRPEGRGGGSMDIWGASRDGDFEEDGLLREKLGMGCDGFVMVALGVICSSGSSGVGGCMVGVLLVGGGGEDEGGEGGAGGGGIEFLSDLRFNADSKSGFSIAVVVPFSFVCSGTSPLRLSSLGPSMARRNEGVHRANQGGSQPGGRTMTQTTEASIKEMPMMAMVGRIKSVMV